jgi:hypothetical protein
MKNEWDISYGTDWSYWLTIGIVIAPIVVGLTIAYFWL